MLVNFISIYILIRFILGDLYLVEVEMKGYKWVLLVIGED